MSEVRINVGLAEIQSLHEPFAPEVIHWRIGATNGGNDKDATSGLALAYIDARDVMERLDRTVGPENWQVRHPWAEGGKLACEIGIRINGEWLWKGDGAGATDVEGDKGSFSDGLKRAAVMWGIGRYLYAVKSPWVAIEKKGRSYVIKQSEYNKLHRLVGGETNRSTRDDDWVEGPAKTRQELRAQLAEAITDLQACEDEDALAGWKESYTPLLYQLKANAPDWWDNEDDPKGMVQHMAHAVARIKEPNPLAA